MRKKLIAIIAVAFMFVLTITSTNVYANKVSKKYEFSYVGFSAVYSIHISNIDREFENALSVDFRKKYLNKIALGYYILSSNSGIIVLINVYKCSKSGIVNAMDAFSFTKRIGLNMNHSDFKAYEKRKIKRGLQYMAFQLEHNYLHFVQEVINES